MINERFLIKKLLGSGRSKVFSVVDFEFPEKEIAMKILPNNSSYEEIDAFREEYFTLRKLDHPNIIKSFEYGTILTLGENEFDIKIGSKYILFERFESSELLNYELANNELKLILIVKQICSAIYYLHQSNYIYYDLKPENILVGEIDDKPFIKIIDLGFAQNKLVDSESSIRGTAEYIAPELLKKEPHDQSVDLYSLGMLLYRIVYHRFPFEATNELDIYKSQIEQNFDFPRTDYSTKLISVIKKLLLKNPKERYNSALQVLSDLEISINSELSKDFLPAKVLSGREDILNILNKYIDDSKSEEIFSLKGFSGSGKSAVLFELSRLHHNSILIENTKKKSGIGAIKHFLHKIIFNPTFFENISKKDFDFIGEYFKSDKLEISDSIKALISSIIIDKKFVLLIDDFNLYDEFAHSFFREILPVFQINRIKVILGESSDFDYSTKEYFNLQELSLASFTANQLEEFIDRSFYSIFPKQDLNQFILKYSDLLPGSVVQFVRDLLILGILKYEAEQIFVVEDNIKEESLRGSHEEIFRLRLSNLTDYEMKVTQLISAFNISVELSLLSSILNKSIKKIEDILTVLQYKNIINLHGIGNSPLIISDSFKRFIYNTIKEKKNLHLMIAAFVKQLSPDFDVLENARHYELGGTINKVVELVNKEIIKAESLSAYSYKKQLIEKLLALNIDDTIKTTLIIEKIKTLFKQSDFNFVIREFENLNQSLLDSETINELLFIRGSSLISIREIQSGLQQLHELLEQELKEAIRQKVLVEIAYANFEQNNFEQAEKTAQEIIKNPSTSLEDLGRIYNLLGMIEVYSNNNLRAAIESFSKSVELFEKAQLPKRVAGIEVNIGNIFGMLGEDQEAQEHWDCSLKINSKIGNLNHEALLLMNYGVYFIERLQFEKAISQLNRAYSIFSTIGDENNLGLVLINLGQVYLLSCNYENSLNSFKEAEKIFQELSNDEEVISVKYHFGKLYYYLNDLDSLTNTIVDYNEHLTKKEYSNKHKLNYEHLVLLKSILIKERVDLETALSFISKMYDDEKREMTHLFFELLNHSLNLNEENKVLSTLIENQLGINFRNNIIFEAWKEYLMGQIASKIDNSNLNSPIEYFKKAYSLIENQSISELTWKVLNSMGQYYIDRGLFKNAKQMIHYASEVVNYISGNIADSEIRTRYLDQSERKKVIDNLNFINNPVNIQ